MIGIYMVQILLCKRCWKRNGIATPPKSDIVKERDCKLCLGSFLRVADLGSKIMAAIDKSPGAETFLVGTRLTKDSERYEEDVWDAVDITKAESIKGELNREIGKWIETHSKYKFSSDPHVRATIDVMTGGVETQVSSVYLYGRYRKLKRGVRQTKKEGSDEESVEATIEAPLLKITKGQKAVLHGCVTGNTLVLLNECSCKIEDLQQKYKEHRVLSYNQSTSQIENSAITDCFKRLSHVFALRTLETDRTIMATAEHPFFTQKGMTPLAGINIGDKVAVNPIARETISEQSKLIIVTEEKLAETIKRYVPTSNLKRVLAELKNKQLCPLYNADSKIPVLARILGFLFGDGTVRVIRHRDVSLEFYGQKIDLEILKDDLKFIGLYSHITKHKNKGSIISDYYGKYKKIKPTVSYRLTCYSKALWVLLVSLGAPIGNKVKNDLSVPDWIKTSNRLIKQEFLSALLGCEIDKPRLDKRKYNKKSFNTPRFSMNKIEDNLDNGWKFFSEICSLLEEFNVRTLKIREVPYSSRKDGFKTIKLMLDFSNESDNLVNLWKNIGFRYCKEKEILAAYALEYLSTKNKIVEIRKRLFEKAQKLAKSGLTLSEIHRVLNNRYIDKKNLWLWIHNCVRSGNIKVPNHFPTFDVWLKSASDRLSEGLVWETVVEIEPLGKQLVYDITVPKNHNFFANGFLVSNSGREDIDVLMAGNGRPFVIEVVRPQIRRFDAKKAQFEINKSAKGIAAVEALSFTDKNRVEIIKRAKFDKTYDAVVELDSPITKAELNNLPSSVVLAQRTPTRVSNRRADLIRKRTVKRMDIIFIDKQHIRIIMTTQSGTYVKEFVSGDEGRTQPSISSLLQKKAKCIELTVTKIDSKWLEDFW